MSRWILVAFLLSASACRHTIQIVQPETRKMCESTGRSLGVQLKLDRLSKEKAPASCTNPGTYASPGQEAQLKHAFAETLRATNCFSSVVDLDVQPNAAVDYLLSGQVVRFDACADLHQDDAAARDRAVVGAFLFGMMGAAAMSTEERRTAAGDAVLEDVVLEERANGAVHWNDGVARGMIRERASKEVAGPYSVADRALALLARDVAVKTSRAIKGRSLYGAIGLEDARKSGTRARIAVVSKVAEDEAAALASMPEELRPRLSEGFPVVMSTEELGVMREDKKGHALVLAFFADEEDAVDWLLSLRPPVQGLEMLLLKSR